MGQGIAGNLRDIRRGYAQQWGLSLQHEFRGRWLVETGYMGNRGVHLPGRRNYDYLPQQFQALGTQLQQLVDNPYFGTVAGNLPLGQRQVTRATLLDTYPQFAGAAGYATLADSILWKLAMALNCQPPISPFTRAGPGLPKGSS